MPRKKIVRKYTFNQWKAKYKATFSKFDPDSWYNDAIKEWHRVKNDPQKLEKSYTNMDKEKSKKEQKRKSSSIFFKPNPKRKKMAPSTEK